MEKPVYNPLNAQCPSRQLLDLIGDKWTTLILYLLSIKTQRYSEMLHGIEGISKKMLTQVLRDLEAGGLITRKVYAVVPPMVEYNLTPLGQNLIPLILAIKDWAEAHMDDVLAARQFYSKQKEVQPE
jgi:DNA-binding HxlR family transcriptional regulator